MVLLFRNIASPLLILAAVFMLALPARAFWGSDNLSDPEKLQKIYEMYAGYKEDFPQVKDITPAQAQQLVKKGVVQFIDIRPEEETEVARLPGAVSEKQFLKNPEKYLDKTLVGYCTISYRSGVFAEKMEKKGIPILNLKGGLLAWVHEGGKVYGASGQVKKIHVYGRRWNYPPKGYEAVW